MHKEGAVKVAALDGQLLGYVGKHLLGDFDWGEVRLYRGPWARLSAAFFGHVLFGHGRGMNLKTTRGVAVISNGSYRRLDKTASQ